MELLIQTQGGDELNKHALFFLSNLETLETKIENFQENNSKCKSIKQKTLKMYETINAFKPTASKKVNSCFRCCYEMAKEINLIGQQKLSKFMKDVKKLETDFSYLLNPS